MKNIFKISFLASIMLLFMNSCTKEQVESASQLSDTEVSLRSTLGCDGGNTVPAPVFIYNMYEDPITGECCFQLRFATAYYGMQWEIWSYNLPIQITLHLLTMCGLALLKLFPANK